MTPTPNVVSAAHLLDVEQATTESHQRFTTKIQEARTLGAVDIGGGIWVMSEMTVRPTATDGRVSFGSMRVFYDRITEQFQVASVTVSAPGPGEALTGDNIRDLSLSDAMSGLYSDVFVGVQVADGVLGPWSVPSALTPRRLNVRNYLDIYRMYRVLGLFGGTSTGLIGDYYGVSRVTAHKWVGRARDLGVADPVEDWPLDVADHMWSTFAGSDA